MIRCILVPLDGSRFAEGALPVALDLARKAHASVRL
jgi:nucleotide-binding universal stress UspA family protein